MSESIDQLKLQITAQEATIQTLLSTAWKTSAQQTAFGLLDSNVHLQELLELKTSELSHKTKELEEALAELAQHQAEVLQTQKLESVGRLAAGVAHEINTPVQFVSDSVYFLSDGFNELFTLYELHKQALQRFEHLPDVTNAILELNAEEESLDFSYLVDQIPASITRCIEGLDRVRVIVQSMKEFAHPDNTSYVMSSINHMINTTVTIAAHEYKYVANLTLELGEIPEVECLQGELNQVILNLIINASHAVQDIVGNSGELGSIVVSTSYVDEKVLIKVSDSGGGIPESVREKIFEPFFTTKAVGQGTGQGLAMARKVIKQRHSGTLTFETETGKGTTFTISLPIRQNKLESAA